MSRELEVGADQALQGWHVSQVLFLELDFASGVSRVCTREHSVDWNSQTWLGAGRVGSIEPIAEGGELESRGIAMTVSALPAGLLAVALTPSEYKGREVRLWFGQMKEERYLSLPGTAGNYASTPDSAALDITGDIDIRVKMRRDDWTSAPNFDVILSKAGLVFGNDSYAINLNSDGKPRFNWSASGNGLTGKDVSGGGALPFSPGGIGWLGWKFDVDNGAGGSDLKFLTSLDGVTWTQLGATVTTAGVTSIFSGNGNLWLGQYQQSDLPLDADVYYAEIRNGIDGPVVAKFDASLMDPGQTSARMPTGELWTILQTGSPAARIVREPLAVVADPVGPFIFKMDQLTWQLGGESASLRLTAESRLADWHRPRVRRYNNPDHQALHPGDKFFEHVERQVEAVHRW